MNARHLSVAIVLLTLVFGVAGAAAQPPSPQGGVRPATLSTGFTYQGMLRTAAGPVDGISCNFQFSLWDAVSGGSRIGAILVRSISVNKGLFTVVLDFGASVFDGNARWLQAAVRCPSDTDLTTLTPRQALTPTPYALVAQEAGSLRLPFKGTGSQAGPSAVFDVANTGTGVGLAGSSTSSAGVYGRSPVRGVHGDSSGSTTSVGVLGTSTSGAGVWGESNSGPGLVAVSTSGHPIEAFGLDKPGSPSTKVFYVANNGDVRADGTILGGGADFAELLPAVGGLEPGDVLIVDGDGRLTRSTRANQLAVVGVYSTRPGFLGGAKHLDSPDGNVPLAVSGIIPVKASAENGPIHPGDLLVASSLPGHAMRAPREPAAGTVIGKALGGLTRKTGVIEMLVMLR